MAYTQPEPLREKHDFDGFCCEENALDNWLHRHSRHAGAGGSARTFVTADGERVIGYYALAIGQVEPDDATERLLKGQPAKRPVPVLVLSPGLRPIASKNLSTTGLASNLRPPVGSTEFS